MQGALERCWSHWPPNVTGTVHYYEVMALWIDILTALMVGITRNEVKP